MANHSPITVARFWSKVEVQDPQRCWPWLGNRNETDYGRFRSVGAHRVAYELIHGDIPEGMIVRHKCDNPPCCNPHHLAIGSYQDNSDDAARRGRVCKGSRHPNSKLTDEQVAEIRSSPLTGEALAKKFGVSKSTISGIRTYTHRV